MFAQVSFFKTLLAAESTIPKRSASTGVVLAVAAFIAVAISLSQEIISQFAPTAACVQAAEPSVLQYILSFTITDLPEAQPILPATVIL